MIAMLMAAALATEDCVVVGDSLAVGVGEAVNRQVTGTSCRIAARRGEPASRIRRTMGPVDADVAIVSAGANDAASPTLTYDLQAIRSSIRARQVIWLLPKDRRAAAAARAVCLQAGDVAVDLLGYASDDGIHPRDYRLVSRQAFRTMTCG